MKDFWYGTAGNRSANFFVVGEAWGFEEAAQEKPFVGQSGQELKRMLLEAGITEGQCFFTNVVADRPQDNEMWRFFYPAKESPVPPLRGLHPMPNVVEGINALHQQLEAVKPKVIIALGNYSLWALTLCSDWSTTVESEGRRVPSGIARWRGSLWYADAAPGALARVPLVPAYHPAAVLRAWYTRAVTVHDFRERAKLQGLTGDWRPKQAPIVWAPPDFQQAVDRFLVWIARCDRGEQLRLMNDIETARGLMTCIGFSDSPNFAMVIPFIRVAPGQPFESFWSPHEEFILCKLMRTLLQHPNCLVEGQNYLYDTQYILRFLAVLPHHSFDSMLAHHLLFPGTPKGLDYLSSLYCRYHWYWKEDHKEWDMRGTIESLLQYNGVDCTRNFEVNTELMRLIPLMNQSVQWEEEKEKNNLALEMMVRGTKIDVDRRGTLAFELTIAAGDLSQWFEKLLPQAVASPDVDMRKKGSRPWWQSVHQQKRFFGEDLGLRLPVNRKTERETFGNEALQILKERHPEFTRVFDNLEAFRSIKVFHNTFVKAGLGHDNRMRCMFNTAGTETFRWSSSEDAFGSGTNLQNIPRGDEDA